MDRRYKPGDRFLHFRLVRELGRGASGIVWLVENPELRGLSAIKMIQANLSDPAKIRRGLQDGAAGFRIDHVNVAKVFDMSAEDDGLVWIRCEYLEGWTLGELLEKQPGGFSIVFALCAAIEAAAGLAAAHDAGIIHRDIKPANLFYTNGLCKGLKVIDWSTARVTGGIETTEGRRVGLGTPAFMAPEQTRKNANPTPLIDIYGLGVTLYVMLAGTNPFLREDVYEVIRLHREMMPPPLPGVPAELDAVVRRALAKAPMDRYPSAMAFWQALVDVLAWLREEERADRIALRVPFGEPPPPGDPRSARDYRAPKSTPDLETPSEPSQRVIVATPGPEVDDLAGTLPMNRALPVRDPDAVTLKSAAPRTARGTEVMRAASAPDSRPTVREAAPSRREASVDGERDALPPPPISEPMRPSRETAPAVTRAAQPPLDPADSGASPLPREARASAVGAAFRPSWRLGAVAIVVSAGLALAAVVWFGKAPPPPIGGPHPGASVTVRTSPSSAPPKGSAAPRASASASASPKPKPPLKKK